MNLHEKTVGIDPNNDSDYDFRHQSMTLDFDPFWMFKMIGDPLVLIGDLKKISLVTPWYPKRGSPRDEENSLRS